MSWKCDICGIEHDGLPSCFGTEAPWRTFVGEDEFDGRVVLSNDQCVVDGKTFFIRGQIEIPIHNHPTPFAFSVWSSLSEKSFVHMCDRWDDPERSDDPPYFGWLCSAIPSYPDTINLKLSIQSRPPGQTPLLSTEPTDHPLSVDQHNGISIQRWHELVHKLLHR